MSSKKTKGLSRRRFINAAAAGGVGLAGVAVLAGCGETQVVEVVKEVPVETVKEVVKEVPVVEERVVTKEVQKVVEKIVTVEAMPAKPQALTLVFATWWALERGGFGRYEQKYMDVFEAQNPHITMEYCNWPWAEFHTKLLTQAAAGTAPDAFAHSNVFYPKYVKRGGALALDEFVKTNVEFDIDDFLPVSLKLSTVDGKLYGLPHISSAWGIIYNKQVMEDAGITESPNDLDARGEWNWESNLEMLKKLTKRDSDGKAERLGQADPGLRFRSSHQWAWQNGGEALKQPTLDEFVLNEPASAEAVQWIADSFNVHKVTATAADLIGGSRSDLNNGRLGMIYTWFNFSAHKDQPVDIVYPPAGPVNRVTILHTNSLGVSTSSKYPDEATEYIALQTSKQGDVDQINFGMGIVLRRSNLADMTRINKADFGIDHAEVVGEVIETGRVFDINEFHQETLDAVNPVMEEIRDGAPAKEKLDEIKPVVDDILAPMRG
ncbi:MAG: sugar ABC transporter substrate-binding protein [Chloroflexi bacterium]|nr:sugar ABC transporter substrate-binding protein [Chloroflexota bacterium]